MGAWYVGTVWTWGGRDSGVIDTCVWNFVRASNVKRFGDVGTTVCAIRGVVIGAARGEFRL